MPATNQQPIIIIKKKGGHHGGHHGGAWKVAYADFVTAMMALFIVLWLMHASPEVQRAVGGYFKDPSGLSSQTGTNIAGSGQNLTITKENMEKLKEKIAQAIRKSPEFQKLKDNVEMTVTNEGLRIELLETAKGMFFESGSPIPTQTGKDLLIQLAMQLGAMKNPLLMEGHTDSQRYENSNYTNWELSADRANAARRIMQTNGLQPAQVAQVRGFADQRLRLADKPTDPSNRRVSIIVQYPNSELAQLVEDKHPLKLEKDTSGRGSGDKPKDPKSTEKASAPKASPEHHG
ncbi:MAG: OmpA family protein [Acidobacteriaceae bacterium]|nr:OmpA family protein [Acidobacteriaceae bacterium]